MTNTSILDNIGNTPMLKLCRFDSAVIYAKAEFMNPGGSVKDRVAKYMIEQAEKRGDIKEGSVLIEATSGNTGIGVSLIGKLFGYRVIIFMPEDMSEERKKLIRALGAEVVLTPAEESLQGAVNRANKTAEGIEGSHIIGQFKSADNPEIHYLTTAKEIWSQMEGHVDAFVAGVGSGGTLGGVGRYLKEQNPSILVIAVEPKNAAALLGHEPGLHKIQGIGDGFIPPALDVSLIDDVITVTDEDAIETTRQLALKEGTLVGTSSGANAWAAREIFKRLGPKRNIVTLVPDRIERYFSTSLI